MARYSTMPQTLRALHLSMRLNLNYGMGYRPCSMTMAEAQGFGGVFIVATVLPHKRLADQARAKRSPQYRWGLYEGD